jgi:hypothetical protein
MSDLIDRQELLKHKGNCYDEEGHLLYAVGTGTILLMPTVDAVEVVRCKDCESWGLNAIKKDEKGEVIYGDCLHFCCSTPKWFYCAWGERKNGQ